MTQEFTLVDIPLFKKYLLNYLGTKHCEEWTPYSHVAYSLVEKTNIKWLEKLLRATIVKEMYHFERICHKRTQKWSWRCLDVYYRQRDLCVKRPESKEELGAFEKLRTEDQSVLKEWLMRSKRGKQPQIICLFLWYLYILNRHQQKLKDKITIDDSLPDFMFFALFCFLY